MEQSPAPGIVSPTAPTTGPTKIFLNYAPPAGAHDEMLFASGGLRPHWQPFAKLLEEIGGEELTRRWKQSQRLIYENGIAHGAYTDTTDEGRPWQLDPLPLLITQREWQPVTVGLQQRAQLLQLILADLYGPQTLIADKILPPEVVYQHPGFRLAYHGLPVDPATLLTLYAADLQRAPSGQWWVVADRTEAPSGLGFVLENRVILSRMLPAPFRECGVCRLSPFFMALQDSLERLAPETQPDPQIAILSQGPQHKNFFEDTYLARYLGYTLVEGSDLAIRNNRAWLKTLEGLLPIDVALRRPNSHRCDPLELDNDSRQGTAGLLRAARAKQIALANPLGSGLVESPIFMAFMPRLCQHLLGEALQLPGLATWWCGEPASLDYTLANLDQLTIKYAYRHRDEPDPVGQRIKQLVPTALAAWIRAEPTQFVAQQRVARSTAPIHEGHQLRAGQITLRAFAVTNQDSFTVMEGGLVRTAPQQQACETSPRVGEGSKDAWILSDDPTEEVSPLPSHDAPVVLRRSGNALPSRVAQNLFWLGRHIERAASAARLLRTVTLRLTGESATSGEAELPRLIRALVTQGQLEEDCLRDDLRVSLPEFEQRLPQMILDHEHPGSLASICNSLFSTASHARDRVSLDTWRVLVHIKEQFRDLAAEQATGSTIDLTDLLNLANRLLLDLAAIGGMVIESMTRSQAFRFLDLGRRLEFAMQSVSLIQSCLLTDQPISRELLVALLETADSIMTYRSRYLANLQLAPVLDLLLTDQSNPRSVAYQLEALQQHVENLPGYSQATGYNVEQKISTSMLYAIRIVDIEGICESHSLGALGPLEELLERFDRELPLLANAISHHYFAHTGPARQLTAMERTAESPCN